jgi:hypothetical protein
MGFLDREFNPTYKTRWLPSKKVLKPGQKTYRVKEREDHHEQTCDQMDRLSELLQEPPSLSDGGFKP